MSEPQKVYLKERFHHYKLDQFNPHFCLYYSQIGHPIHASVWK